MWGFFIIGLVVAIAIIIKEAREPVIPVENWENWDLYCEDSIKYSPEQMHKNLVNGKYKGKSN